MVATPFFLRIRIGVAIVLVPFLEFRKNYVIQILLKVLIIIKQYKKFNFDQNIS